MTKERAAIRDELLKLESENQLSPKAVVDRAKDPANPMHKIFEWNDKVAGKRYRLQQARALISDFEVLVEVDERTYNLNEFVEQPQKKNRDQGYVSIHKLVDNKRLAMDCVNRQLTIARTYADKSRDFALYLGLVEHVGRIVKAIDDTLGEVGGSLPPAAN